ncbi:hypothetical protein EBV26_05045 [bacterium]|nr:hypothetical protein [bacterium]
MSTIIQIKRSSGSSAPTTSDLLEGEMAYAQDASGNGAGAKLYIESIEGSSAAIHAVGGKYFTDKVDARLIDATSTVGGKATFAEGTNNGSSKVTLKAPNSLAGDLTLTLPATDGSSGHVLTTNGSGVLSFSAPAASSFTLAGDTGTDTFNTGETLTVTGGTGLSTAATDNEITIDLDDTGVTAASYGAAGTVATFTVDAQGRLTAANDQTIDISSSQVNDFATSVDSQVDSHLSGGTGITYSNGTIDLDNTTVTASSYGSASAVATFTVDSQGRLTAASDTTIDITASQVNDFSSSVESAVDNYLVGGTGLSYSNGTIDLDDTTVTAGSYGDSSNIPTFTVDAQGRITSASTASISTYFDVAGDSGTATIDNGTDTLTIAGGTGVSTSVSSDTVTIDIGQAVGTSDDVTFNSVSTDTIKDSGGTTALTLDGANVTVSGNLTVSGTTTTVNSTTLSVTDPLVFVGNDNNSTDAVDLGLFGMYDHSGSQDLYAGIFRDATDGKWKLFKDLQSAPTTTVNTGGAGYTVATLVANLEGGTVSSLASAIAVADGGTGAGTFTSKGILYGNGTSALAATGAGTAGQVLLSGGSGGTPSFGNIDGGTY